MPDGMARISKPVAAQSAPPSMIFLAQFSFSFSNWRNRRESNPHYRRDKPACWPLHHDPVEFLVEPPGFAPGPRGCKPRTLLLRHSPTTVRAARRRAQKNPALPGSVSLGKTGIPDYRSHSKFIA